MVSLCVHLTGSQDTQVSIGRWNEADHLPQNGWAPIQSIEYPNRTKV